MAWVAPAIMAAGSIGSALLSRGGGSNDQAAEQFNWNAALQREFAQNGVRWRVADAQAAGVHPLFALGGGSLPSASPISYVGDSGGGNQWKGDIVKSLAGMGANIADSQFRTQTKAERQADELHQLSLERSTLENDLLRDQLARNRGWGIPAFPSGTDGAPGSFEATLAGQGNVPVRGYPTRMGVVDPKASENVTVNPRQTNFEAGANPENKWIQTERGWKAMPSKQMGLDDMDVTNPEYWSWAVGNRILPHITGGDPPPDHLLPEGATGWQFIPFQNEYRPSFENPWMMGPLFTRRRDKQYEVPEQRSRSSSWWHRPVW